MPASGRKTSGADKVVGRKRRSRRTTEEIVDLLIQAAISEFEEKPYPAATTAGIAKRAGVAEALLFTNFGSKAGIFAQSVFKSLNHHWNEFNASHLVDSSNPNGRLEATKEYINALQDFISNHSGMLMALVFAQSYNVDEIEGVAGTRGLHEYFRRISSDSEGFYRVKKISPMNVSRISFATLLSCILFKDWLFPDEAGDAKEIRDSVTAFIMEGLSANDPMP